MATRKFSAIIVEALVVVIAGAGFAFAANEISPKGLFLARDYFPKTQKVVVSSTQGTNGTNATTNSGGTTPTAILVTNAPPPTVSANEDPEIAETDQRIKGKGLQPIDRAEVEKLFHDPRYGQGLIVFIDARSDSYYSESHIPGAYPLDRFHPEKHLAEDINPCMSAEQVVVYCTGGECEDAEYTALETLQGAGVPPQKIFVYGGGFDDWSAHHLPLEQGTRNSGVSAGSPK